MRTAKIRPRHDVAFSYVDHLTALDALLGDPLAATPADLVRAARLAEALAVLLQRQADLLADHGTQ